MKVLTKQAQYMETSVATVAAAAPTAMVVAPLAHVVEVEVELLLLEGQVGQAARVID